MLARLRRAWAAFWAEPGLLVVHPEQPVRTGPETETVTTATLGCAECLPYFGETEHRPGCRGFHA